MKWHCLCCAQELLIEKRHVRRQALDTHDPRTRVVEVKVTRVLGGAESLQRLQETLRRATRIVSLELKPSVRKETEFIVKLPPMEPTVPTRGVQAWLRTRTSAKNTASRIIYTVHILKCASLKTLKTFGAVLYTWLCECFKKCLNRHGERRR